MGELGGGLPQITMTKISKIIIFGATLQLAVMSGSLPGGVASALAADCSKTSASTLGLQLVPITDLGASTYQGFQGGLYDGGINTRPSDWESAGQTAIAGIYPRNAAGLRDDTNGKIVMVSIGMSNGAMEFGDKAQYWTGSEPARIGGSQPDAFAGQTEVLTDLNPKLVIINAAQSGKTADKIANIADNYWNFATTEVTEKGFAVNQVQAVWIKEAIGNPTGTFPGSATALQGYLESVVRNIKTKFPNVQVAYLSSRIYAGYSNADLRLNPEPYAYESAFAVKWLIEKQRSGDASLAYTGAEPRAPWLSWGPYLWADGINGRGDGLTYLCGDVMNPGHGNDGIHPAASGMRKVGAEMVEFFKSDTTSCSWFTTGVGCSAGATGGDANGDGRVDGLDYVIWVTHFGQNTGAGSRDGDFNLDGNVNGQDYGVWRASYGTELEPTPTPTPRVSTPTPLPNATNTPTPRTSTPTPVPPTPTPTPTPNSSGGLPVGPFHFGDRVTDYDYVKDGVVAGTVFTGGFLSVDLRTTTEAADGLLKAAREHGNKIIMNVAYPDPCSYWDGAVLNQTQMVSDVNKFLPTIASYQDIVLGIMLLNEPHDPTRCTAVPASSLYGAAAAIRAEFGKYGIPADFPLGFGAPPEYFSGVAGDGVINLVNAQYAPKKGTISSYVSGQQATAASLGIKLYLTVNAVQDGTNTAADMKYMCDNVDKNRVLMVGYWSWNQEGGNQTQPLNDFVAVKEACEAR